MRLLKLLTSIAAGACVFAVSGARAQVTNAVTFSAVTFNQGPTNTTSSGTTTNTVYGPTKTKTANTALLLQEIGKAINANGTGAFNTGAKLVLITGQNGATFAVIDGTNFYDLSSNAGGSNIMNVTMPINVQIRSGTDNNNTVQKKETDSLPVSIVYDDTFADTGNQGNLIFTLDGLVTFSETATAPVNGTFTDTVKGKISSMTGGGTSGGIPFTATGTISFSGTAKLPVPST